MEGCEMESQDKKLRLEHQQKQKEEQARWVRIIDEKIDKILNKGLKK
jgi:hypothetical protein